MSGSRKAMHDKLHEDVANYCAFYAVVNPAPLLNKYPQAQRKGAAAVARIARYT